MRAFSIKLAVFVALQAAVLAGTFALYRVDEASYLSVSLRKQARLQALASPRLILVGGSAAAYGYHSPVLAEATGRATVNMGIQASLGLDVKLAEVAPHIGRGDLVVLALEYPHYGAEMREGLTLWGWLEQDWSRAALLSAGDAKALLDTGQLYLRVVVSTVLRERLLGRRLAVKPPADPGSFDAEGDVVGHRDMPTRGLAPGGVTMRGFSHANLRRTVADLQEFGGACRARGARAVIYFPPIPAARAGGVRPVLEEVERALRAGSELDVLNHATDNLWPEELFFDSFYHLTWEGEERNTRTLLAALSRRGLVATNTR